MKKLASMFLAASLYAGCNSDDIKPPVTPEEREMLEIQITNDLPWTNGRIRMTEVANIRNGINSVILVCEDSDAYVFYILERKDGKLRAYMQDKYSKELQIEQIAVTDVGHDGGNEIEIRFVNGRRVYYVWNNNGYKREDPMMFHSADTEYFKDMDGDGVEECILLHNHDPSSWRPFQVYKWEHGWREVVEYPAAYAHLNDFLKEYNGIKNSGLDVIELDERKKDFRERVDQFITSR